MKIIFMLHCSWTDNFWYYFYYPPHVYISAHAYNGQDSFTFHSINNWKGKSHIFLFSTYQSNNITRKREKEVVRVKSITLEGINPPDCTVSSLLWWWLLMMLIGVKMNEKLRQLYSQLILFLSVFYCVYMNYIYRAHVCMYMEWKFDFRAI